MTIETKLNNGDNAVFIVNNKIVRFPVRGIEYKNGTITYAFLISKAATSLDRDNYEYKDESNCFKSVKELTEYYENKLEGLEGIS